MPRCSWVYRLMLVAALGIASVGGCTYTAKHNVVRVQSGRDAKSAAALVADGVKEANKGCLDKAEVAFHTALIVDDSHGPAHNNLGLVFFEKRDLYSAAWAFERAREFMPQRAEPVNNLGLTYEAAGHLDAAIEQYRMAANMVPHNAQYLGNLLRARRRRGDDDFLLRMELQQLLFLEKRPEWVDWAGETLVMLNRQTDTQNRQDEEQTLEFNPSLSVKEAPAVEKTPVIKETISVSETIAPKEAPRDAPTIQPASGPKTKSPDSLKHLMPPPVIFPDS